MLTDISAKQLLSIADLAKENGVLLFNVGSTDDILREHECRSNVFHTAPTRTMLADGLAQYLIWKQWRNWVLLYGSHEPDQLFADAIRRSAKRFGATIVEERLYKDTGTARRTDSGVVQVQRQIRSSPRDCPTMMSSLLRTRARSLEAMFLSGPGTRGPSPARRASLPRPGIRPANNGAALRSRTAS
ncbi:hypothetical protein AJ87_45900 [Rhizobium yanglingense]|nr:hypothetical protein AJ87_45900 [Rhizobium yanglingense]